VASVGRSGSSSPLTAIAATALVVAVAWSARAERPARLSRFEFTEPHMGTTFRVVLYAGSAADARAASARAFARIGDLDRRLTDYVPTSELSRVTREAVGHPIRISDDLLHVLAPSQELARRSDGAFDVTVGPLTRLWRRARREVEIPAENDVSAARQVIGYRLLHIDDTARTIEVDRPGMQLDAGGIAKGYAADQALAVLRRAGLGHSLVAAGGDLAIGDPPPGQTGWTIALAGLDADHQAPSGPLIVARCGVSTSGDAEQWVELGGTRYSHILDPRTGRPLEGHTSVTVVAGDATTSDMLATAVSVLGPNEGRRLVDGWHGASAIIGVRDAGGDRWVKSSRWRDRVRPN
jgi:thiamine biosynthesis lipoprotein